MTTPTSPEPVAWLHILHMEHEAERTLTFTPDNPFGRRGRDYSESFWTEHIALVIAAAPAPPVPEVEMETSDEERAELRRAAGTPDLCLSPSDKDIARRALRDIDRLQAALADAVRTLHDPRYAKDARRAAQEEALAAIRRKREDAIHSGSVDFVDGVANGFDRAERVVRALIPEPVSAPPEADK